MATTVTPPAEANLEPEDYAVSMVFTVIFPDGKKTQEVLVNQYGLGYEALVALQEAITTSVGVAMVGLGKAKVAEKKAKGKIK